MQQAVTGLRHFCVCSRALYEHEIRESLGSDIITPVSARESVYVFLVFIL